MEYKLRMVLSKGKLRMFFMTEFISLAISRYHKGKRSCYGNKGSELIDTVALIQVRQATLGRTNSGRSYIVKKSTYD